MSCLDIPTVNEILYNRERLRLESCFTKRPNLYKVGEWVRFRFGTLIRRGRISNAMCHNGICTYHIVTSCGTWYREIGQDAIISQIQR